MCHIFQRYIIKKMEMEFVNKDLQKTWSFSHLHKGMAPSPSIFLLIYIVLQLDIANANMRFTTTVHTNTPHSVSLRQIPPPLSLSV